MSTSADTSTDNSKTYPSLYTAPDGLVIAIYPTGEVFCGRDGSSWSECRLGARLPGLPDNVSAQVKELNTSVHALLYMAPDGLSILVHPTGDIFCSDDGDNWVACAPGVRIPGILDDSTTEVQGPRLITYRAIPYPLSDEDKGDLLRARNRGWLDYFENDLRERLGVQHTRPEFGLSLFHIAIEKHAERALKCSASRQKKGVKD